MATLTGKDYEALGVALKEGMDVIDAYETATDSSSKGGEALTWTERLKIAGEVFDLRKVLPLFADIRDELMNGDSFNLTRELIDREVLEEKYAVTAVHLLDAVKSMRNAYVSYRAAKEWK